MIYANYSDYIYRYLGRAIRSEDDFDRLALRASAFLDRITFGRAEHYRDTKGKLALACCAVAERLQAQEEAERMSSGGAVEAEQVGDWRVQYRDGSLTGIAAELAALAEMYLTGTGLLYRGVPATSSQAPHPFTSL